MNLFGVMVISLLCVGYFLGMVAYMIAASDHVLPFLSRRHKNDTTKVGFVILIIVDVIMFPWVLIWLLVDGIILLIQTIIFKEN